MFTKVYNSKQLTSGVETATKYARREATRHRKRCLRAKTVHAKELNQ
jgi:hypothetical protein